jgi:hypothetical protein
MNLIQDNAIRRRIGVINRRRQWSLHYFDRCIFTSVATILSSGPAGYSCPFYRSSFVAAGCSSRNRMHFAPTIGVHKVRAATSANSNR